MDDIIKLLTNNTQQSKAVLTCHKNPDPDSIGSNLAFAEILKQFKFDVTILTEDAPSPDFDFLNSIQDITVKKMDEVDWTEFDVFFALDQADKTRNGFKGDYPSELKIVNIDHHETNPLYGTYNYVLVDSPSTCSLITDITQELLKQKKLTMNAEIATNLILGLLGDTGFYSYSMSPEVLDDSSFLLEHGAQYDSIIMNLRRSYDLELLRTFGDIVSQARMYEQDRLIVFVMPLKVRQNIENKEQIKGMLDFYCQSIKGVDTGMVIVEESEDMSKLSFRSRTGAKRVDKLAQMYGGGGHQRAAGATVERKDPMEIIEDVRNKLRTL